MRLAKKLVAVMTLSLTLMGCLGLSSASVTNKTWSLYQSSGSSTTNRLYKNNDSNVYFYQDQGYGVKTELLKLNTSAGTMDPIRSNVYIPLNVHATIRSSARANNQVQLKFTKVIPVNTGVNSGVWSEDSTQNYTIY